MGTFVVALILAAIVALIVMRLIHDKKEGKSSCGCGCQNCAMNGKCHSSGKK